MSVNRTITGRGKQLLTEGHGRVTESRGTYRRSKRGRPLQPPGLFSSQVKEGPR